MKLFVEVQALQETSDMLEGLKDAVIIIDKVQLILDLN